LARFSSISPGGFARSPRTPQREILGVRPGSVSSLHRTATHAHGSTVTRSCHESRTPHRERIPGHSEPGCGCTGRNQVLGAWRTSGYAVGCGRRPAGRARHHPRRIVQLHAGPGRAGFRADPVPNRRQPYPSLPTPEKVTP